MEHVVLGSPTFWIGNFLSRAKTRQNSWQDTLPTFFRCQHMTVFLPVKKNIIQQWCPYGQLWEQPLRFKEGLLSVSLPPARNRKPTSLFGHLKQTQSSQVNQSRHPKKHPLNLHSLSLARAPPSFILSRGWIATEYMGLSFLWYMTTKFLFDSKLDCCWP